MMVVEIEMFRGAVHGMWKYETVEMITRMRADQTRAVGQPCSSLGIRPPNPEPHFFGV